MPPVMQFKLLRFKTDDVEIDRIAQETGVSRIGAGKVNNLGVEG